MTIAEMLCAGQKLTEKELRYLATAYDYKSIELGDIKYVAELEGCSSHWIRHMDTIFKKENEFYDQSYRVREVGKMVEVMNYLPWEEEEDE